MSEQESKSTNLSRTRLLSLAVITSFCLCFSAHALASLADSKQPSGAIENLLRGKNLFERQRFDEALDNFRVAYDGLPEVRDYIIFFMARTYKELGRTDEAAGCVNKILKNYPDSLLRKRVRAFEIDNHILGGGDYLAHLESYVADYPEDDKSAFNLALLLKEKGETDKAKKIFIRLYTYNTPYSERAYREMDPSDITANDMLVRVTNLMKTFEYRKAETILKKMLSSVDNDSRDELQRKLGLSLFRQKKYMDAADVFLASGDLYNSARSFLRAGDFASFRKVTDRIISMEDRRASSLLLTYAARKRREGDVEEALKIYRDVKKKYPSRAEDALWGIAWTQFRSRDSEAALSALRELNNKYPSPRYRYWKKKCTAADASSDAEHGKIGRYKDIYGLLSDVKDADSLNGRLVRRAAWTPDQDRLFSSVNVSLPSDVRIALKRFAILVELEMKEDAAAEVLRIANKASRPEIIMFLSRKLQEAGAYNKSVMLASKFGRLASDELSETSFRSLLYPFAYWPVVDEMSRRYSLDPFVLLSVIREESRFDPSARSFAGALGLMQLMPETAFGLDRKVGLNISDAASIYNIRTNIALGAYYLNSLLKEFGSLPAALAAYNAGSDRVKNWIKTGNYDSYDEFIEDIPYDETRNYVKRVLLTYSVYLDLVGMQR